MRYQYLKRGQIRGVRTTMRFQSKNIDADAISRASQIEFIMSSPMERIFRLAGLKWVESTGHSVKIAMSGNVIEVSTLIPADSTMIEQIALFFCEIHAIHLVKMSRY